MGNTHIRDYFNIQENLNKNSTYLTQFLNAEIFNHNEFLKEKWLTMNVEKAKEFKNLFDWNNVHQMATPNEQVEEKQKIKEFKENLLVGHLPQETASDFLNPQLFNDFQTSFSPSNVESFTSIQNQKFLALHQIYHLIMKERKFDFSNLTAIKNNLSASSIPKAAEVGIRSGIMLLISLLREASKSNSGLRDETLNFLIELFAEVKPLSLWGNKQIDIILDKSLHTVADFLEELIQSNTTSEDSKSKALKVLFSLGLLRGSLPNLLSVVNLLRNHNLQIDLGNEIKLFKNEKADNSFIFQNKLRSYTKIFFNSTLKADAKGGEKAPNISFTTDGKFIYLHSELEGLLKIGTGFEYTMFGKVYIHLPEYRIKEKGTLAFIFTNGKKGKLYYRSGKITKTPLIEIDPETLQELPTQIEFDNSEPNCIFSEMTNPEIEFHPEIDEESKQAQQKKAHAKKIGVQGQQQQTQTATDQAKDKKRDIHLMRPVQRSPMCTEGRLIYIISQWTADNRGSNGDSDDEDEGGQDDKLKYAKYGVDIYDPLKNFEHVRSVELYDPQMKVQQKSQQQKKDKVKPPLNIKILDVASFTTNGSEIVVGIPAAADVAAEMQYKYFDLTDGKLVDTQSIKEQNYYPYLCYDTMNNVVWGINDQAKKTFSMLACYSNTTIPENFKYSDDMEQYLPYENSRIVDLALEQLGFSDEVNLDQEKMEKIKEEWHMLLSLGFTNQDRLEQLEQNVQISKENENLTSKAMQTFILANIARLADSYANLEHSNFKDSFEETKQIENFRKPYCVNLLPKVFNYLEQFLDHYSEQSIKKEDNLFDQCSLLCTLRIIKYNLAHLEIFQNQLKKMNIQLPSVTFSQKLQKLITLIFENQFLIDADEDIKEALYDEAISILRYNLSIIHPSMTEIFQTLNVRIKQNIDNKLNQDIILAFLGYLKQKHHIIKLIEELSTDDVQNRSQLMQDVLAFISFINENLVNRYIKFIHSFEDFLKPPVYNDEELTTELGSFLVEFQKEIFYQLAQKIEDKSLNITPMVHIASFMTEQISKNSIKLNSVFEEKIKILSKNIEIYMIKKEQEEKEQKEAQENQIQTQKKVSSIPKKSKEKEQTLEDKIQKANNEVWVLLVQTFIDKALYSQILTFQINTLCLLVSDFLIASKTLKPVLNFLESFNKLYMTRKQIQKVDLEKNISTFSEKSETFESEHPPQVRQDVQTKVHITGALSLRVVFDPKTDLKRNCDWIQFFSDEQCTQKITERMDKAAPDQSSFPKEDLIVQGDTFFFKFHRDNCGNQNWGYKFVVYANITDQKSGDWMHNFHRTTTWLASKCAAQLVNGSALQQALLSDEEQKYNVLLNSKLFSGGIEKCHFSGGKESVWTDFADYFGEFNAGHLTNYLSSEITENEKEQFDFLMHIIEGNTHEGVSKLLAHLQAQFKKQCLWSTLGGEVASKLVRSAFACIIKHSGMTEDFIEAVFQVDEIIQNNAMEKLVQNFIKKWTSASRMRTWLVEKRKDIDEVAERSKQQAEQARANQNKQLQLQKIQSVQEEDDGQKGEGRGRKKGAAKKKKAKEEAKIEANEQIAEKPISLEIQDTEQIISRMTEQIQKKAIFMIQLVPAQYWTSDVTEKKDKLLLFKTSSQVEDYQNKEEEWKKRLQQWKLVRQSKGVIKSLEDESQQIHSSLTAAVLGCLQSPVSLRRLRKQVESSYLRAICRTIGLNALTQIINTPGSHIRQDVVGWLISSLRGNENKLYHFTDNLQGCGYYLESAVNTSFKNVMVAIVKSMSRSNNSQEIKCMLEALKWKYHGDDHSFLSEIDLFGILRGQYKDSLLRQVWGKGYNSKVTEVFTHLKKFDQVDGALVKKLIELFEIIVVLCVGKLQGHSDNQFDNLKKGALPLPGLERHVSTVDEYSAEILIKQIFEVIFTELNLADINYRSFSGIDWAAWMRAKMRREKKDEDEKKKKKDGTKKNENFRHNEEYGEEAVDEEENEEIREVQGVYTTGQEGESEQSWVDEEEQEFYENQEGGQVQGSGEGGEDEEEEKLDVVDEEEFKDEQIIQKQKKPKKSKVVDKEKDKENQEKKQQEKIKKIRQKIEEEERTINDLINSLYSPEFLYRLLALIYKCVAVELDQVSIAVGTPKQIGVLFSLMQSAPPVHRILIMKILTILFKILPQELFGDSLKECLKVLPEKQSPEFLEKFSKLSKQQSVVSYLLHNLIQIRSRIFTENIDYNEDYSVSCELVVILRNLLSLQNWNQIVQEELVKMLQSQDELQQLLVLQILGGEINGLRFGGMIKVCTNSTDEMFDDNILLKQNLQDTNETAIILGFSDNYKEKVSEEEQKKIKDKADDPRFHVQTSIGSIKDNYNPVVLVHSYIAKEITSLTAVELTMENRFNSFAIDNKPFDISTFSFKNSNLVQLYKTLLDPKKMNQNASKTVYLKTLAVKSIYNHLVSQESIQEFIKDFPEFVENIMQIACEKVVAQTSASNLELTEERLFRILKQSSETNLNLSDLAPMSATVKRNELEILFGKDFNNMKYLIQSGYNLDSINQFYEVADFVEAKSISSEKLTDFLQNKALLVNATEMSKAENQEILVKSKLVITFDFDMQALKDQIDSLSNAPSKKSKKGDEMEIQKSKAATQTSYSTKGLANLKQKLPMCIVNIAEKYFIDLYKELSNQKTKDYKNVFVETQLVDELVEFGFPKDVCEDYLKENPKTNLETMIGDIIKIIETQEVERKKKQQLKDQAAAAAEEEQQAKGKKKKDDSLQPAAEQQQQLLTSKDEKKQKDDKKKDDKKKDDKKKDDKKKKEEEDDYYMQKKKMLQGDGDGDDKKKDEKKQKDDQKKGKGDSAAGQKKDDGPANKGGDASKKETDINFDDEDEQLIQEGVEIEKEDPNVCFKCKGDKEIQQITDEKNRLYDSVVDSESLNDVGKLILFKQTNHNLAIYYARRIILSLLESWPANTPNRLLEKKDNAINFLKLISFEGIFSSSAFSNNTLIFRIQKLIQKYFESSEPIQEEFSNQILNKCIFEPVKQLETTYLIKAVAEKAQESDDEEEEKESNILLLEKKKKEKQKQIQLPQQIFTGRVNNESEIDGQPFIDFSLKLADVAMNCANNKIHQKISKVEILYVSLGMITVLRQNKSLGWGIMIFILNYIEFLKKKLDSKDLQLVVNFFNNDNILNFHKYLYLFKQKEQQNAYSRTTQIISEVLVFLNRLQRTLEKYFKDAPKIGESKMDLERFRVIEDLTDVVEMMENYQSNVSLIASTWLQLTPELIKKEQKFIDGDHFYYKNIHSFQVNLPFTAEATLKFSEESQTDIGDSILLSSDPKGELSLQKYSGNLGKTVGVFPAGTFYFHFPAQGSDIYSWGTNDNSQLSQGDASQNGPFSLESFSSANVVTIDCGDTNTMLLNKNGELYSCGSGSQTGIQSGSTKTLVLVPSIKNRVTLFSCGSNFSIFYTESNEMFAVGSNTDGRCGLNYNNATSSPIAVEFSKQKQIKQISCGTNHSLVLTTEGHVYATGSNDFGQLGLCDENDNKIANSTTFKHVTDIQKRKVHQIAAGQNVSLILVKDKLQKQTYVLSTGEKALGRLGLGKEGGTSTIHFTEIEPLCEVGVNFVTTKKKHGAAITSSGTLYTWGNNEFGQLGHGNQENQFVPLEVEFFEDMRVMHAALGNNHTVVIAKKQGEESTSVYTMGENTSFKLCLKEGKEKVNTPTLVEFFDEKNAMKVFCGNNHTLLMTENMKIPKFRDEHKVACYQCNKMPIVGPMIIDPIRESELQMAPRTYCYDCVDKKSQLLIFVKENVVASKEHLNILLDKTAKEYLGKFANEKNQFDGTTCKDCKVSPITDVLYVPIHDEYEKEVDNLLCEKCAQNINQYQVSPTIYYRLTSPINKNCPLPIFQRNQFYTNSDTYGYSLTITPKFSEKGHDYMIEKYKQSYDEFSGDFKNIQSETDEQLVDLINSIAQKKEKKVVELEDKDIQFPKDEINIRSALEGFSEDFLKKRFQILKNFNSKIKVVLPYIDFSARKDQLRLRNIYSNSSVYIFWDIKSDLFEKILAIDTKAESQTKIKVNRLKASKFIEKGKPDNTGEYTVFGQIFSYFKNEGYNSFKVGKDKGPFTVQFVGEASIDVGGPYREAISQMCTELQSGALALLIPSPNQKNDGGQFREKWVLNPGASTLIHMKMYEFLGALMGCSIRSRNFLNLDLPSIVWKSLVDAPLTKKDLENIDKFTIQCLDDLQKKLSEDTFSDLIQEQFVTSLSNGQEVELIPGGSAISVTYDRREEYSNLVIKTRLNEFKKQADALKYGLSQVIPLGLLNLLTWRELETLVCGKPVLDLDLLKQNTVYRGCSETDTVIEFFWKALTEFSAEERSMYLRFVWGRSRLPLTSKDFPMKHTIELLRKSCAEPDIMLPVAHTCFFSIELPKYSQFEILRDKLKYAITHCQAIDTDGRAFDVWEDDD